MQSRCVVQLLPILVLAAAAVHACDASEPAGSSGDGEEGGAPSCTLDVPPVSADAVAILDEETWPGPGRFSLRDPGNLALLSLDPDGRARWIIDGGDYVASGSATWVVEEEVIRIAPELGNETFPWIGEHTISSPAVSAVLAREDERHVTATVTSEEGVVEQRWETGYLCRNYCTDGQLYACDLPFDVFWDLVAER